MEAITAHVQCTDDFGDLENPKSKPDWKLDFGNLTGLRR
jgi:hypothetical protein